MDDTERMEVVKRAYAEIILNTAAESAARVLASERKAMGFQRSLATTKQDAVDMMLCLKSLMDSKINGAETRNLLYVRRIQELESQLEKAKSVILSLQSDLEREREVNKNKTQQAGPIVIEEEENTSSYYQNVTMVHRVLIDIVNAAANATARLGRYPPFKRQVIEIATTALESFKTESKNMVVALVDMERAFVPPQHFICLVQRRMERQRREDEVKYRSSKKGQEAEQSLLNRASSPQDQSSGKSM